MDVDAGETRPFPNETENRSPFDSRQSSFALPIPHTLGPLSFGKHSESSSSGALQPSSSSSSKSGGNKADPPLKQLGLKEFTSLTTALKKNETPEGKYPVDIVAVHGLTGGLESTWEVNDGEKDVIWLRDFLPKDLPGARVFSYGYDAEIWNSLNTARFRDMALELLANLKGKLKLPDQEPDVRSLNV